MSLDDHYFLWLAMNIVRADIIGHNETFKCLALALICHFPGFLKVFSFIHFWSIPPQMLFSFLVCHCPDDAIFLCIYSLQATALKLSTVSFLFWCPRCASISYFHASIYTFE